MPSKSLSRFDKKGARAKLFCEKFLPTTNSADGVKISYKKEGRSGQNVILIHGWCCDGTYWRKTIPNLSQDHKVYIIDLAGHGNSGTNRRAWTIDNYGEDVKALADKEKLSDVTLVGHSMGGDVALAAAQLLSDRVKGVILVDTYHNITIMPEKKIQEMLAPLKENFHNNAKLFVYDMFTKDADPKLKEDIAVDMSSEDASIAIPSVEATIRYNEGDAFDKMNVPVRCINCDMSPSDYDSAREHLRDFGETTMKGLGHFLMLENPEEFNAILRDTIASL